MWVLLPNVLQRTQKLVSTMTGRIYVGLSLALHTFFILIFIFNFTAVSMLPVVENTNQQDVISAVVLGDSAKSNIIAPPQNIPTPQMPNEKALIKNVQPQLIAAPDVLAIKPIEKLKKQKPAFEADKKLKELFGKNLLADIADTKKKHQKLKQKYLQKQFEKGLQQQAEQALRQQLIDDNIKLQSDKIRKAHGQVDKYKALILQAIGAQWIVPAQVNRNLTLTVMIKLAPGGLVLDVQVTKTSGNPSLDSSVRAAILKASPLPVPQNSDEFSVFRQFILKVKPENILNNDIITRNG